ncbi:MAG: NAD(P)H-quinone oxidoreductase [Galactobacter sp.]
MRMVTDTLPTTMAVAEFAGAGGPDVIELNRRPIPSPGPGEVLIRVEAAGLNRADVQQRKGHYPPPPGASDVPGLEVAGTIVSLGRGVRAHEWAAGQRVAALLTGGGYAEYAVAPVTQLLEIPEPLDLVDAAGLPEVACTVVSNLLHTVTVRPGDWVLVHGGSGGIGSFALQMLREFGARAIATGSSAQKLEWALDHGAAAAIDHTQEDFVRRVEEITEGHGADVILDVVGAKYLSRNVDALGFGGRLVVIGLLGGARAELDLGKLLAKRAGVVATSLRSRPEEEKAAIVASVQQRILPLAAAGRIRVDVDRVFPLSRAKEAHEYFDSGVHRGKVLLRM